MISLSAYMGRRFQNYVKPSTLTFQVNDKTYVMKIKHESFTKEAYEVLEEISRIIETDQPYNVRRAKVIRKRRQNKKSEISLINEPVNNNINIFDMLSEPEYAKTPSMNDALSFDEKDDTQNHYDENDADYVDWSEFPDFAFDFEEPSPWPDF